MENAQQKKRDKIVQEWEEWQEKQKQMASANAEISVRQLIMAKEALAALQNNPEVVERISKSTEIGLDKFISTAQSLQKTASALMREYFQVDEILEEMNNQQE